RISLIGDLGRVLLTGSFDSASCAGGDREEMGSGVARRRRYAGQILQIAPGSWPSIGRSHAEPYNVPFRPWTAFARRRHSMKYATLLALSLTVLINEAHAGGRNGRRGASVPTYPMVLTASYNQASAEPSAVQIASESASPVSLPSANDGSVETSD